MPIYKLYVKTHKVTGLKYLGYTGDPDPYQYLGSGKYWMRHLEKHGKDITTEILYECLSKEEIKERGLYYSELWDVVNATDVHGKKIWANLMPESANGGGYIFTEDDRKLISKKSKEAWDKLSDDGRTFRINAAKSAGNQPLIRERNNILSRESVQRPEVRAKISATSKETWTNPELRKKQSELQKEVNSRPGMKERKADKTAISWQDPNIRKKRITNIIDDTIYTFYHIDGRTECCNRYDLIIKYKLNNSQMSKLLHGLAKSHKGWRIHE